MKFVVETNHKPLEVICGPLLRPCARIERWVLRLQPYDFSVIHRPGQGNIGDPLSRLLRGDVKPNNHRQSEEYVRFVAVNATPTALTTREIEEASAVDEELVEVRKAITTGQFEKCKQYMAVAGELCVMVSLYSEAHALSFAKSYNQGPQLLLMKDTWEWWAPKRTSGPRCGGQEWTKQLTDTAGYAMDVS